MIRCSRKRGVIVSGDRACGFLLRVFGLFSLNKVKWGLGVGGWTPLFLRPLVLMIMLDDTRGAGLSPTPKQAWRERSFNPTVPRLHDAGAHWGQ